MLHNIREWRGGGEEEIFDMQKFSEAWNMGILSLVQVYNPLCMFLVYKNASAYFMVSILVSQHAERVIRPSL
jgi:hypothetical protein